MLFTPAMKAFKCWYFIVLDFIPNNTKLGRGK